MLFPSSRQNPSITASIIQQTLYTNYGTHLGLSRIRQMQTMRSTESSRCQWTQFDLLQLIRSTNAINLFLLSCPGAVTISRSCHRFPFSPSSKYNNNISHRSSCTAPYHTGASTPRRPVSQRQIIPRAQDYSCTLLNPHPTFASAQLCPCCRAYRSKLYFYPGLCSDNPLSGTEYP